MSCISAVQTLPKLSQGLPELRQSLPELTQTSAASQRHRSYGVMFLLTCSYLSHLKHLLLRAFLESCFREMLSKVGVLDGRGMKKSKKHRAIAPAALGGCGGLGQLWEALAELREALGELWEGLECDLNS